MYRRYEDLRDRLGEPLWHDDKGVPRYLPFHPNLCGVYDRMAALLEIDCQGCDARFLVAGISINMLVAGVSTHAWPSREDPGVFHFGDAPYHVTEYGPCVGTTMTTDVCRVVEFWTKDGGALGLEWRRRPEYEFTYPAAR